MKRNYIFKLVQIFIIILSAMLIYVQINVNTFTDSIIITLKNWLYNVVPPIFIFYIIASLVIKFKILSLISFIYNPLNILFQFDSKKSIELFFISILIGNPGFSSILTINYKNNNISYFDYKRLLNFCSFQTPLYIISLFPYNKTIGFVIILANILASIILLIFSKQKNHHIINDDLTFDNSISFSEIFYNSFIVLLNIASIMIFFNCIIFSLDYFNIPKILFIYLELTNGISIINEISLLNIIKIILITSILSFNCFSIHMQIFTYTINISYFTFLINRIIITTLTITITIFILLGIL